LRERPFTMNRQQVENGKQNVDIAPPWKNFCGRPCSQLDNSKSPAKYFFKISILRNMNQK